MRFFTIYTSKKNMVICWLLIKILYDYLSVNILDGLWYQGYGSYAINYNPIKEIIGLLVMLIVSLIYVQYNKNANFITSLMHTLFLIYYIPMNSSYSIQDLPNIYFFEVNIYFLLLIILTLGKFEFRDWRINISSKVCIRTFDQKESFHNIQIILGFICILCIICKVVYNGFSFSTSIFSESLYDQRAAYVDAMNSMDSTFSGYLISLVLNLSAYAIPVYIYYSLRFKKFFSAFISVLALFSLFSIIAGKGTILFSIIILGLYYFEKRHILRNFNRWMEILLLIALAFCFVIYTLQNSFAVYFIVFRRAMFLPSWLNYLYYDFFSENIKVYLSQSTFILQRVIPSNYDCAPTILISRTYFNSLIPSPNTGLFADAYLNLGIWGILLYPIIISKISKFAGTVFDSYSSSIGILIGIKFAINLTNVQIFRTDFVLSFFMLTILMWLASKIKYCSIRKAVRYEKI